ncbi:MAG: hypothetical protein CSB13_01625 [Chloroflexi bacterium]|nr:MAG: hypothetical protein CSB13_01625 [Chloroflexota bacterium]
MYSRKGFSRMKSEKGQGLTEYALILMLAGLVAYGAVRLLEPSIEDVFQRFVRNAPVAPPALIAYTPPPTPSPTAGSGTATATPPPTDEPTPLPFSTPAATSTAEPTAINTVTATATPDSGYREYRYVRVIAESEVNGHSFASMAEMGLRDGYNNEIDRTDWSVHYVSSQETDGGYYARNVFDGNTNTMWHTEWRNTLPSHPHDLQIDLGALYNLSSFQYLPRQIGTNGRIANYRFCASVDGTSWELLTSGTFSNSASQQSASFTPPTDYDTMPDCPLDTTPAETPTPVQTSTSVPTPPPTTTSTPTPDPGAVSCRLAVGKTAVSSSNESGNLNAGKAVDDDLSTRWSSSYNDNEWIYVDLGARYDISRVIINWEDAYGRDYRIQVSDNSAQWTTLRGIRGSNGGRDDIQDLDGTGRFVRMRGLHRGTEWGYSIWEFEVCGTPHSQTTLIDADFENNTDGFSYQDDTFYNTDEGYYARGNHANNHGYTGDGLRIRLGGRNDSDIYGMSGGYQTSFNMPDSGTVDVSFYYSLYMPNAYEWDECSEVLVSIDDQLYGNGNHDYVSRNCDGVNANWRQFSFTSDNLAAGAHTLTIGGYNNQKTTSDEMTRIWFDDVLVEISN